MPQSREPLEPAAVAPVDPEHDVRATYALDPSMVRRLTAHLLATSGDSWTPLAPFTGQPLGVLPRSRLGDVVVAASRARLAQTGWRTLSPQYRGDVLLRFHDLLLERQDEILDLVQWESGKARLHAFEEVVHVALTARYYARRAAGTLASSRRHGLFPVLTRVDVHQLPKGLIGVISPWNYPLSMGLADGLAAIAAGNAVLHKPDQQTMLSALWAVALLQEAGAPPGLWQVVGGAGAEIGPAVVDAVDHVCFTGSTRTGREVAQRAAGRLIGASLELGGKNPMLVLRDADLDRAAEGAVRGCFSSAGQLCVSMERIYVADQVYDRFLARFLRRVEAVRLSAALDFSGDMGSLVSQRQLDVVARHVDDARSQGARVLAGGRARPDVGPLFYAPTVLTGVRPGMVCFAEETFGPVVSLYRFSEESDAVARANEGPYGLNASVFTADARRGRALASRIRCGSVNINEAYAASFASIDAPMGGMGQSGLGRRQGPEGLLRFTEPQTVVTERALPLRPVLGLSSAAFQQTMTGVLRMMNALRRP
jgi:succinate-semialdehyde dehydrogenase/glutarate-semialdehyde dehydrogenase